MERGRTPAAARRRGSAQAVTPPTGGGVRGAGHPEHQYTASLDGAAGIDTRPRYLHRRSRATGHTTPTAETLAIRDRVSRREQDEFALRSHRRAAEATDSGAFRSEVIPTWGRDDEGRKRLLTEDQCIR